MYALTKSLTSKPKQKVNMYNCKIAAALLLDSAAACPWIACLLFLCEWLWPAIVIPSIVIPYHSDGKCCKKKNSRCIENKRSPCDRTFRLIILVLDVGGQYVEGCWGLPST